VPATGHTWDTGVIDPDYWASHYPHAYQGSGVFETTYKGAYRISGWLMVFNLHSDDGLQIGGVNFGSFPENVFRIRLHELTTGTTIGHVAVKGKHLKPDPGFFPNPHYYDLFYETAIPSTPHVPTAVETWSSLFPNGTRSFESGLQFRWEIRQDTGRLLKARLNGRFDLTGVLGTPYGGGPWDRGYVRTYPPWP
jgi:hypothetical protein